MRTGSITRLVAELARIKIEAAYIRARRSVLARIAADLPTDLLDDARIAATEELARRGYHVITHRPRSKTSPRQVA